VEPDNGVDEGHGNSRCRVGVAEGDEVCILGEAVHHYQDDRLTADLGDADDKIERDVEPYTRWHRKRLQEAHQVKVLCFVALPHKEASNEVIEQLVVAQGEEGGAQAL
jgi:hypothetical protein